MIIDNATTPSIDNPPDTEEMFTWFKDHQKLAGAIDVRTGADEVHYIDDTQNFYLNRQGHHRGDLGGNKSKTTVRPQAVLQIRLQYQ